MLGPRGGLPDLRFPTAATGADVPASCAGGAALFLGMFWRGGNRIGALLSMGCGFTLAAVLTWFYPDDPTTCRVGQPDLGRAGAGRQPVAVPGLPCLLRPIGAGTRAGPASVRRGRAKADAPAAANGASDPGLSGRAASAWPLRVERTHGDGAAVGPGWAGARACVLVGAFPDLPRSVPRCPISSATSSTRSWLCPRPRAMAAGHRLRFRLREVTAAGGAVRAGHGAAAVDRGRAGVGAGSSRRLARSAPRWRLGRLCAGREGRAGAAAMGAAAPAAPGAAAAFIKRWGVLSIVCAVSSDPCAPRCRRWPASSRCGAGRSRPPTGPRRSCGRRRCWRRAGRAGWFMGR